MRESMMDAIQFHEFGGPNVLKHVSLPIPSPQKKDVLIKVAAIGVNYADTARREGKYVVPTPLPFVPGSEVAGEVVACGEDVTDVSVGQKVVTLLGSNRSTGYAQYTLADSRSLIPIPSGVTYEQAVALPLQGLSAYHILKSLGQLSEGETVLVHAAAGGVGSIAIQLAKKFGAKQVIATASTEEKRELASTLGADVTIDYTKPSWVTDVMGATDGTGVDLVLEMVGGDIFLQSLKCLKPFGRLVCYGVASGHPPTFNPVLLMEKNLTVTGFFLPTMMQKPDLFTRSLQELLDWMAKGELTLVIGETLPLNQAAVAHTRLQSRKTKGKVILIPTQ